MAGMDGIQFTRNGKRLIVDSTNADYLLEFEKSPEYFSNLTSYTRFVKEVEKLVRSSKRYSAYKAELMGKINMDHCQVLSDMEFSESESKDVIEMHHGPIFNLFDVCSIVLEYFLYRGWVITTMTVADMVLSEHEKNRVQVVMLCSSIHEMVHNGDVFLNVEQGYGKLDEFIAKYEKVFPRSLKEKYNRYMDRSMMYQSNDFGNLEINQKIFHIE